SDEVTRRHHNCSGDTCVARIFCGTAQRPISWPAKYRMKILVVVIIACCVGCSATHTAPPKPAMADAYLDLITTYVTYSPKLWHDDPSGASVYWGDGIAAIQKNGNGAVRGMCNTMLGY